MVKSKFKIKKVFMIWTCVVAVALMTGAVYALNSWDTGYRVNNGSTGTVDLSSPQHSDPACRECKKVTDASGKDIFVPTKSCAEWNAFKANLPAGVTVSNCFVCGVNTVSDADGNVYNTVPIGTQCWMKENIRVGARINGGTDQSDSSGPIQKYCWNNNSANCATYGGYYQWHEAMRLNKTCDDNDSCLSQVTYPHQGICPAGWHIPSDVEDTGNPTLNNDWYATERTLWIQGGSSGSCSATRVDSGACSDAGERMQVSGSSGLEIRLVGSWTDGSWVDMNVDGHYWSSGATTYTGSEPDPRAWARNFESSSDTKVVRKGKEKHRGFPVRCIKN